MSIAQTNAFGGDTKRNVAQHLMLLEQARKHRPDFVLFPELSLTGYEPSLAVTLAFSGSEDLLQPFQQYSNETGAMVGVGAPITAENGVCIGTLFFRPHESIIISRKEHLHVDEEPYFVPAKSEIVIRHNHYKIGLAICYEMSVPEHMQRVSERAPDILACSVAKTAEGVDKAHHILSRFSRENRIVSAMSNCVGTTEDGVCVGQSQYWLPDGETYEKLGSEAGLLHVNVG